MELVSKRVAPAKFAPMENAPCDVQMGKWLVKDDVSIPELIGRSVGQ